MKISEAGWQALADDAPNRRAKSNETPRVHHHVFTADLARPRRRSNRMNRRNFITVLSGAAAAWPLAARAQQPAMPVIGLLCGRSANDSGWIAAAFRRGLAEVEFVKKQNVAIEYRLAEYRWDRLDALVTDLVQRQVTVIARSAAAQRRLPQSDANDAHCVCGRQRSSRSWVGQQSQSAQSARR